MNKIGDRRLPILSFVYRGLIIFLLVLVLIFIGGTIYGILLNSVSQNQNHTDTLWNNGKNGEGQTFTGIGRIRVPTVDPQPGTVIVFVSFIYDPNDKAFSEELVLRIRDFRDIIVSYLGSFSVSELQKKNEDEIKKELLRRFNTILRLGQIESLIFSDFLILG